MKAHYTQNQFGSNSYPYRKRGEQLCSASCSLSLSLSLFLSFARSSAVLSTFLAFSLPSGRGILASLAKIRMRLVLLTVERKGLARGFKRRRQRRALRTMREKEGIRRQRGKNNVHRQETKGRWRGRRKKAATLEVEVKIILREFHLSTRRAVSSRGAAVATGGEESGPAFPLPFSLLPFPPASLFVFTLGTSRGGCVKARL